MVDLKKIERGGRWLAWHWPQYMQMSEFEPLRSFPLQRVHRRRGDDGCKAEIESWRVGRDFRFW